MLADYFTKPLQGSLFRRLKNQIMGLSEIESLKERVEDRVTNVKNNVKNGDISFRVNDKMDSRRKRSYADVVMNYHSIPVTKRSLQ